MAQASRRIEREILSEPHVAGRRISVLQLHELVEGAGEDPDTVAERFDLDLADVYHALAYYHDHPKEMEEIRRERRASFQRFHDRLDETSR